MVADSVAGHGVSAVIVTHNSAQLVPECIRTVREALPAAEIVLVDNASSDETVAVACSTGQVTIVKSPANVGYARACNTGAIASSGPHIVFLNPDVSFVDADHDVLMRDLAREPFGLVGPLFADRGHVAPLTMPHRPWLNELAERVIGPLRPRELTRIGHRAKVGSRWWLCGACLLVRKDEFLSVGGFGQEYFLYYEDRDLARRYDRAGLPLRTTQALTATHAWGKSSSDVDATLRVVPHAWAYLGWLEYVATWDGARAARLASMLSEPLHTALECSVAHCARAFPSSARLGRKAQQLSQIRAAVRAQVDPDVPCARPFCPQARALLRPHSRSTRTPPRSIRTHS